MCLLDLLQRKRERWECHVFFFKFLLGGANVVRRGEEQEKKFFIDNAARGLILSGDISFS